MSGYLFTCVGCRRDIRDDWNHWRNGRDRHLAPLCISCERGDSQNPPKAGAFMDRRMATQISALANLLGWEANTQTWRATHGSP